MVAENRSRRPLPVVAVDGPSGAGKSTVGKRLARRLDFRYIDTGAIYRALALRAQELEVDWRDEARLGELVRDLEITFEWRAGENHVLLGGVDRTAEIRSENMGLGASAVSSLPAVRAGLLEVQRRMGDGGGIVMDGRDIGTVIFPDAEVKFFLTADPAVRARRRYDELQAGDKGGGKAGGKDRQGERSLAQVTADLEARDRQDSQRAVAPLRQAEDAVRVDSSEMTIDAVVALMARHVEALMAGTLSPARASQ